MSFTFTPTPPPSSLPSLPRDPRTMKYVLGGIGALLLLILVFVGLYLWRKNAPSESVLPSQNAQTPEEQGQQPQQPSAPSVSREIPINNPPEESFDPTTNRFLTAEEKALYGFPADWVVRMTVIKDGEVYRPQFERVQ